MDNEEYSVSNDGHDSESGEEYTPPPSAGAPKKKGLMGKITGLPLRQKILFGIAGVVIVFIPVNFAWKHIQEEKSQKTLLAARQETDKLRQKALQEKAQHQIVQNGFATPSANTPFGGQGFPASQSSPSGAPPGGGCVSNGPDLAALTKKIDRMEKILETSVVTQEIMRKTVGEMSADMPAIKNTLAQVNNRSDLMEQKLVRFCAASGGQGSSPAPMQSYDQAVSPPRPAAVFSGWHVLGASGNGAVLMDPQESTHLVVKGTSIGPVRVTSIDPDTGYVAFSNGEVLKPS